MQVMKTNIQDAQNEPLNFRHPLDLSKGAIRIDFVKAEKLGIEILKTPFALSRNILAGVLRGRQ